MCRVFSPSSVTYTVSPLDRNWCSRNANSGRPLCGSLARSRLQRALERLLALVLVRAYLGRQVAGCPLDGGRDAAGELALVVPVEAERGLDPACQRVANRSA